MLVKHVHLTGEKSCTRARFNTGVAIIGDGQMAATREGLLQVTHDDISFAQCNCGVVHIVTSQLPVEPSP